MHKTSTAILLVLLGLTSPAISVPLNTDLLKEQELIPMSLVASNLSVPSNLIAAKNTAPVDEDDFSDEDDGFYDEEGGDEEWEVDDTTRPSSTKALEKPKGITTTISKPNMNISVTKPPVTDTNTSATPSPEITNLKKEDTPIVLDTSIEKKIEEDIAAAKEKDQSKYIKLANTFKLSSENLNNLFSQYGDILKGLNPENPRDLKEIQKLIEIVGVPQVERKVKEPTLKEAPSDDPIVNFSARNIPTRDAFATLARVSGKSITVSGSIQDRDTISVVEINNQPFSKAFLSLIEASDVDFSRGGDNYTILKKKGTKTSSLLTGFDTSDIDLTLPLEQRYADIAYDNEDLSNIIKELSNRYGVDVVMTATPTEKVTLKVRGVNIEDAFELLFAGSQFSYTRKGDTFVVYSSANKNFALDKKTILFPLKYLAAQEASKLLPAELKNLVQVSENQNAFIAEGSKAELTKLFDFIRTIDKQIPQVELSVKLVEVSKGFLRGNQIYQDQFGIGKFGKEVTIGSGTTAVTGIRGTNFTLDPDQLNIFKQFPTFNQNSSDSQIKVNQRLLVTSGKSAKINFDQDINVVLGSGDPATGGGSVGVVQNQRIQRVTAGNSMDITPVVGGGGVVSVKVEIEVSANNNINSVTGVPRETIRRRISSEIQINNDETIALGGLFDDRKNFQTTNEIPLLSRLPLIGQLFSNNSKEKSAKELIILITPHIKTGDDTEEVYVQAQGS